MYTKTIPARIDPRVDIAFKKIFGVEENKDLLRSLLNSIVSEADQIDEIELLNPYNERNFERDKLSILDIKARNKHTGDYFLVEMQLSYGLDYHKRGLYGWARVYANQLAQSNSYDRLNKVIAIHLLNFMFINYKKAHGWVMSAPNKYHHQFVLSDKETRVQIFDDIEIHTIELVKFEGAQSNDLDGVLLQVKDIPIVFQDTGKASAPMSSRAYIEVGEQRNQADNTVQILKDDGYKLDKWVTVLTRHNLLDSQSLPKEMDLPEIKKALGVMENMKMDAREREVYEARLDFIRIESSSLKRRFLEGQEQGRKEGREEGREEGWQEGKKIGEAQERMKVAKNLLAAGVEIHLIAQATGLSQAEIQSILGT